MEKNKIIEKVKKYFKKNYNIEINDTIDLFSLIDSSLSFSENVEIVKRELSNLGYLVLNKNEVKELERKFNKEVEENERKYYEDVFRNALNNSIVLERFYEKYYKHIDKFLENERIKGMIIIGDAGIGKTFNLIKRLRTLNKDFVYVCGHISALQFYRIIFENREKIIVINDALNIFENEDCLNILLNALDLDYSIVKWVGKEIDIPNEFVFRGKIFIILNKIADNEIVNALKDRCIFYELKFSNKEIIEMMYAYAKIKGYDTKVVDFIKELNEKFVIKNLSLRLIDKIYNYDDFEIVKDLVELGEEESLVLELSKSFYDVNKQISIFIEKTGLSRRTFFRIKKKLRDVGLI
ncbi:MAG: hypothetical protein QW038_02525 [Nanopusillaceae archaeon]